VEEKENEHGIYWTECRDFKDGIFCPTISKNVGNEESARCLNVYICPVYSVGNALDLVCTSNWQVVNTACELGSFINMQFADYF
jgi:hypothetical protein